MVPWTNRDISERQPNLVCSRQRSRNLELEIFFFSFFLGLSFFFSWCLLSLHVCSQASTLPLSQYKTMNSYHNITFDGYNWLLLLLLLSRFSHARPCATPQTAAHQAPPSLVPEGDKKEKNHSGSFIGKNTTFRHFIIQGWLKKKKKKVILVNHEVN